MHMPQPLLHMVNTILKQLQVAISTILFWWQHKHVDEKPAQIFQLSEFFTLVWHTDQLEMLCPASVDKKHENIWQGREHSAAQAVGSFSDLYQHWCMHWLAWLHSHKQESTWAGCSRQLIQTISYMHAWTTQQIAVTKDKKLTLLAEVTSTRVISVLNSHAQYTDASNCTTNRMCIEHSKFFKQSNVRQEVYANMVRTEH